MKKSIVVSAAIVALCSAVLTGCGYNNESMDITKIDVDTYITSIPEYTNLTVETDKKTEITDQSVDDYINYWLGNLASAEVVDRAIVEGDVANIDYEGFVDGVAFDGGKDEGYDLTIGSGTFIPGFESGLIGYSAGDEVDVNVTFPETYTPELAGKDAVFKVKINSVSEMVAPELTDEMVTQFGVENVSNMAEFKAYIKTGMEESADDTYMNTLRNNILEILYDGTQFASEDVPANLLNYYVAQIEKEDTSTATQYGVTLEQFVSGMYSMTYEEYEEQVKEQAKIMVRDALICEKIARENKIKVSDKELKESLDVDLAEYGYDEDDYRNYLIQKKVIDYIIENSTVVEK